MGLRDDHDKEVIQNIKLVKYCNVYYNYLYIFRTLKKLTNINISHSPPKQGDAATLSDQYTNTTNWEKQHLQ